MPVYTVYFQYRYALCSNKAMVIDISITAYISYYVVAGSLKIF